VTTAQLIVTGVCAAGVLMLTFAGVFWLGLRAGARSVARELLECELLKILDGDVIYDDDEDDAGGGVGVLA
jgi:hypothetical protein